jgi:hypothetical protein
MIVGRPVLDSPILLIPAWRLAIDTTLDASLVHAILMYPQSKALNAWIGKVVMRCLSFFAATYIAPPLGSDWLMGKLTVSIQFYAGS